MTTRNELAEQRSGRLPDAERRLYESFRRLGMDPAAALAATQGRDALPSTDPFEELTETFQRSGLSREGAKFAATGRWDTEREVHEALTDRNMEDRTSPRTPPPPLTEERLRELRRDPRSGYSQRVDELMEALPISEALAEAERALVEDYYRGGRSR